MTIQRLDRQESRWEVIDRQMVFRATVDGRTLSVIIAVGSYQATSSDEVERVRAAFQCHEMGEW